MPIPPRVSVVALRTADLARSTAFYVALGWELSVSVTTVRSQVQAIYRKLQVNSRTEAVTKARQLGLLPAA